MTWEDEGETPGWTRREWVKAGLVVGASGALGSLGAPCTAHSQTPFDPSLAERLKSTYRLARAPRDPSEFVDLWRDRIDADPRIRERFRRVRDGTAVIGETTANRGQVVFLPDGRKANVMCGYDSLMTAVLRNGGIVHAACFHCGERTEVHIVEDRPVRILPETAVFWLGDGPRGIPVCDHLNLFPSLDHLAAWLNGKAEELAVALAAAVAVELFVRMKERSHSPER